MVIIIIIIIITIIIIISALQRLDLAIPGTLLELRVASPNVGIAPCATRAAAQCAACPEWLSREQRLKAAEGGHATAQTKMGIELTPGRSWGREPTRSGRYNII